MADYNHPAAYIRNHPGTLSLHFCSIQTSAVEGRVTRHIASSLSWADIVLQPVACIRLQEIAILQPPTCRISRVAPNSACMNTDLQSTAVDLGECIMQPILHSKVGGSLGLGFLKKFMSLFSRYSSDAPTTVVC